MLRRLHTALKPAGRLVLAEPISEGSRGLSRDEQVQKHDLEAHYVEAELRAAGFHVAALTDPFATTPDGREDYWLIVARRQLPSGQ
jgi:predicted methyltransferase